MVDGSALPGVHFGRLGWKKSAKANVFWKSKLAIKRRPDITVALPAFKDMLQLESLSAEMDLFTRERHTTSVEKLAAQKGPHFFEVAVSSMLDKLSGQDPVLVVDTTPYLGDGAVGMRNMQQGTFAGTFKLFYLGLNHDSKDCLPASWLQSLYTIWFARILTMELMVSTVDQVSAWRAV